MGLKRKEHWAERHFNDFLLSRASVPFAWGTNDCAMFSADGILAQTDVDIAGDFRGHYTDEASAFALVKQVAGGDGIADAAAFCAAKYGLTELQHPLMAQRGDLVVIDNGSRLISGLIHLSGRQVVTPGDTGLVLLPIKTVRRAWRIE